MSEQNVQFTTTYAVDPEWVKEQLNNDQIMSLIVRESYPLRVIQDDVETYALSPDKQSFVVTVNTTISKLAEIAEFTDELNADVEAAGGTLDNASDSVMHAIKRVYDSPRATSAVLFVAKHGLTKFGAGAIAAAGPAGIAIGLGLQLIQVAQVANKARSISKR